MNMPSYFINFINCLFKVSSVDFLKRAPTYLTQSFKSFDKLLKIWGGDYMEFLELRK
jgi:hypothetical protein